MDLLEKSLTPASRSPRGGRDGIALATALFSLLVVTVLAQGMWTIARLNNFSAVNREDAARALNLAEAGVAHALGLLNSPLEDTTLTSLLQGSDGTTGTADDGLLIGHGLPTADVIPTEGIAMEGGTYYVTLIDDPADSDGDPLTDSNSRILARCTSVTDGEGSASIDVVIGVPQFPALASNGDLTISGNPEILGPCGGVHANNVVIVTGTPTVQTQISASDSVEVSGHINQAGGGQSTPLNHQPPVEVPDLDAMDYCDTSDFILRANGYFVTVGPPRDSVDTEDGKVHGWTYGNDNPVEWVLSDNSTAGGSYCVEGNVVISGNPSGPGGTPIPLSLFADGSVKYSGNPTITAAHPTGALIMANGDVIISGNPSGSEDNYNGLIYAQSQCQLSGNPTLGGQMLCRDDPNPPGAEDYADENKISGNPTIRYNCGGMLVGARRILSWYQTLGGY